MGGRKRARASALGLTAFLGGIFLINQFLEFSLASYSIRDATFGRILLTLTGFHGFHVFVGLVLLLIRTGRLLNGHFTASNHTRLELRIWY
jgi:cytochrome c oxidase subunit III